MADVITQSYVSVGGAQRTMAEGWTWNAGGDIHESRPSSASIVEKDGGLPNHSFTVDWTDASYAFLQILWPIHMTTAAYELRPDDGSVSGTNPSLAGNCVVNIGSVPFTNGGIVRGSSTFEVDSATLATS
jgi:hypothetical protein